MSLSHEAPIWRLLVTHPGNFLTMQVGGYYNISLCKNNANTSHFSQV